MRFLLALFGVGIWLYGGFAILALPPHNAQAKINDASAAIANNATVIEMAEATITVGEYLQHPLQGCVPWVTSTVWFYYRGEPTKMNVQFVYVFLRHGKKPYIQASTTWKHPGAFAMALQAFFQDWPGAKIQGEITNRRDDVLDITGRIKNPRDDLMDIIHIPEPGYTLVSFGWLLDTIKANHAATDQVKLRCSNVPLWAAKAWPYELTIHSMRRPPSRAH